MLLLLLLLLLTHVSRETNMGPNGWMHAAARWV
jgi:hypothetical protein